MVISEVNGVKDGICGALKKELQSRASISREVSLEFHVH